MRAILILFLLRVATSYTVELNEAERKYYAEAMIGE